MSPVFSVPLLTSTVETKPRPLSSDDSMTVPVALRLGLAFSSSRPASRSPKLRTQNATVTTSTEASETRRCSASPTSSTTRSSRPRAATLQRATSSIFSERSTPSTCTSRMRRAISIARSPVPVATSRIRCGRLRRTMRTTRRRQMRSMFIESVWFSRSYLGAMLSNISRTSSFLVCPVL